MKTEFEFSRNKKHSFIDNTKLQLTKLREKRRQISISHYLFKNQIFFESQNDHKLSRKTLDTLIWS